jgi:hypothetical protein
LIKNVKEKEDFTMLMVQFMKDSGSMIAIMEEENIYLSTEINMKGSFKMEKLKGLVYFKNLMLLFLLGSGEITSSMEKEKKSGRMV